jgi:hypothetical protein
MVGFRLKAVEAARIEINGGAASVILSFGHFVNF